MPSNINSVIKNKIKKKYFRPTDPNIFQHVTVNTHIIFGGLIENFRHESSAFHTTMRVKKVEFNLYIYTLSKLSHFCYEIFVFNTQQGRYLLIRHVNGFIEECSYVKSSRKHWKFKYAKYGTSLVSQVSVHEVKYKYIILNSCL